MHQFSLNLRSDLHGTGVRVACIEPGMCGGTEFSVVRFGGDTAKAAATYDGLQPLTRRGASTRGRMLSELAVSRPPSRRPARGRAWHGTGVAIHLAAQLRRGSRRQASEPRLDHCDRGPWPTHMLLERSAHRA